MDKCLLLYHSDGGATRGAAEAAHGVLIRHGWKVTLATPDQVSSLLAYQAVLIASPIRYGKPARPIADWLQRFNKELVKLPSAVLFTCLRVTQASDGEQLGYRTFVQDELREPPKPQLAMGMLEKTHSINYYLQNLYALAPRLQPQSVAFFRGRLSWSGLALGDLLAMWVLSLLSDRHKAGDHLRPEAIADWARRIVPMLGLS